MSSTTTPRVTTWTNPWGKVFHYCTDCKGTADDGAKLCPTHAAAPEMRDLLDVLARGIRTCDIDGWTPANMGRIREDAETARGLLDRIGGGPILKPRSPGTSTLTTEPPRFTHDCTRCVFLGQHGPDDLYFHPDERQTVIARWGSIPQDYSSGLAGADFLPALGEAKRRAVEMGLLARIDA